MPDREDLDIPPSCTTFVVDTWTKDVTYLCSPVCTMDCENGNDPMQPMCHGMPAVSGI